MGGQALTTAHPEEKFAWKSDQTKAHPDEISVGRSDQASALSFDFFLPGAKPRIIPSATDPAA